MCCCRSIQLCENRGLSHDRRIMYGDLHGYGRGLKRDRRVSLLASMHERIARAEQGKRQASEGDDRACFVAVRRRLQINGCWIFRVLCLKHRLTMEIAEVPTAFRLKVKIIDNVQLDMNWSQVQARIVEEPNQTELLMCVTLLPRHSVEPPTEQQADQDACLL